MESEPPTWDLLQLLLSRQLPHLIIPAQPSSRNEELVPKDVGLWCADNCFIQLHH